MDKVSVRTLFAEFFEAFNNLTIETISVHGAHDFCVWESKSKFQLRQDMPGIPFKTGEVAVLSCASLIWWNGDKKILKEVDYAVWDKN